MKKCMLVVWTLWFGMTVCCGAELSYAERIQSLLLSCRHPGDPTPTDDLRSFAAANKLANNEMSDLLMQLAKPGLDEKADATQHDVTHAALWGLAIFGGEEEYAFVLELLETTNDDSLQKTAVRVGIRMVPENWENLVRKVAATERFDSLTRYDAYEEAYRIGRNGDERTRQRVEQVLSELEKTESNPGNRMDMRHWSEKLKAP